MLQHLCGEGVTWRKTKRAAHLLMRFSSGAQPSLMPLLPVQPIIISICTAWNTNLRLAADNKLTNCT